MTEVAARWRRLQRDDGVVLLDGFHALKHALRFGARILLAVTDDPDGVRELADRLAPDVADRVSAHLVVTEDFPTLVARPHPTRVAALAARPPRELLRARLFAPDRRTPVVVLDNPRHLGNIGAVVRLAAGLGTAGVLTTGTVDPWHPNVLRGAAGLHFATAVARVEVGEFPDGPVHLLDPAGEDLRSVAIPDDAVLVFGSERYGISPAFRSRAHRRVAIPMHPKVSSYNLATSVAMALFHWASTR
ncbi:MAG TPA: TrmH family RNA methyltransferase [Thermobifida alba]|nr:TrmH family RNA methyltransferase [Thermobifida alba]